MSHTYFCCNTACPNGNNLYAKKCGDCQASWYCSESCQKVDWPGHKTECRQVTQEHFENDLFHTIAARLDIDPLSHPFEHFKGFMKHHSWRYSKRTTQEWMEDWLSGWYNEDRERKEMLREMFQKNGMKWSSDAYTLYLKWADKRHGNRFDKMAEFIKLSKSLF